MSDLTIPQLHERIRGIIARNDAIRLELETGVPDEKGTAYEQLLRLEIPLNEARMVMAYAHLDLMLSIQKREAARLETGPLQEAMS